MQAVTFHVSIPRFLLVRGLGAISRRLPFGSLGAVRLSTLPEPEIPGPRWVKLEVLLAGICGTDLANLTFRASPAMEPFASFPAVPGHEILARVVEVGEEVSTVQPGDRVVVDPFLSCRVRGYPPGEECPSCREGWPATCERAGEEGVVEVGGRLLGRGLTVGYHRDLPGGWGERLLAHESQLHRVPEGLDDRVAVLAEPLSIALHAVLGAPPRPGDEVLVLGSGTIAQATIWALRATGFRGGLVAQVKRPHEEELARALGASEVVAPGPEARERLVDTGALAYQPLVGPEVFWGGGFPLVYDCVGSGQSLAQALRFVRSRGRIVMLGCAGQLRRPDLTFLWARELEVRGFLGYGGERWEGVRTHTFDLALGFMRESATSLSRLVTHVFPLAHYRDALRAAANHRRSGAVKVVLAGS